MKIYVLGTQKVDYVSIVEVPDDVGQKIVKSLDTQYATDLLEDSNLVWQPNGNKGRMNIIEIIDWDEA